MGMSGEVVAEKYAVGREEQDQYAAESHRKAAHATRQGWFKDEILPISIPERKGEPIVIDVDEPIREDTTSETLSKLKPAFKKDGSVTAGNAPGVNDAAAAVVIMAATKAAAYPGMCSAASASRSWPAIRTTVPASPRTAPTR